MKRPGRVFSAGPFWAIFACKLLQHRVLIVKYFSPLASFRDLTGAIRAIFPGYFHFPGKLQLASSCPMDRVMWTIFPSSSWTVPCK